MGRHPILVTGTHRSGTTWVGRMIAASPRVVYVHEPFNPERPRDTRAFRPPCWFTYLTASSGASHQAALARAFGVAPGLGELVRSAGSPEALVLGLRAWAGTLRRRVRRRRVLVKDPIALLSAEWIEATFHAEVILVVRHPAAFAASVRRVGWYFPFEDLLGQPELLRDHLAPLRSAILEHLAGERDLLDEAALAWRILHTVLWRFRERHPDWTVVRHEDLSRDPIEGFGALYSRLGLPFGAVEREVVRRHSAPSNPRDAPSRVVVALERDSAANATAWMDHLSRAETERIRSHVEPLASRFYDEMDWRT